MLMDMVATSFTTASLSDWLTTSRLATSVSRMKASRSDWASVPSGSVPARAERSNMSAWAANSSQKKAGRASKSLASMAVRRFWTVTSGPSSWASAAGTETSDEGDDEPAADGGHARADRGGTMGHERGLLPVTTGT